MQLHLHVAQFARTGELFLEDRDRLGRAGETLQSVTQLKSGDQSSQVYSQGVNGFFSAVFPATSECLPVVRPLSLQTYALRTRRSASAVLRRIPWRRSSLNGGSGAPRPLTFPAQNLSGW